MSANIKPPVRLGQRGEALFKSHGVTWWNVVNPDDDWNSGGTGSYGPFGGILADDPRNLWPDIDIPEGTVVRVTVEAIKVGDDGA